MRLLTFRSEDGARLGMLRDEQEVVELSEPPDMLSLIDSGEEGLELVNSAFSAGKGKVHKLGDLRVLAPLPNPRGNVIAIGRNYQAHAEESARASGKTVDPPTVFTKAVTSVAGPYDDVVIDDAVTTQVDWEVELGVVIGRAGANIARERALDHVFGFVVVNDVSARDIQFGWGGQYFKGKSLDGFCPIGPWIVTPDELTDTRSLRLRLRVNGDSKQEGNTRDMIYPVDAVIEWVSKGMTLPAGTIIATGTPDGVGFARTPPEFLKPGDVVEAEVEGIGTLRNRFVSGGK
ncbi:MAG: fumarylacetoacetate hydrolase family protein [Chloroflexi bacterium]|nr:MAG: fumarylacetoacetate hydrolase family protein [Chloroflexota bacterium]TMF38253.1 MAG: fumarylacetoacetate hydrolase family protein [Chloroflexota bacterium]